MNTNVDLNQLAESIGDAIIVSDVNEKIVLWNAAAIRIFGYAEGEALGNTVDLIVPDRLRHRPNEGYRK